MRAVPRPPKFLHHPFRMNNHLRLLGLGADASPAQIRQAYRRRALRVHPDHNADPDAAGQFQALEKAYAALIRPRQAIEAYSLRADPRSPDPYFADWHRRTRWHSRVQARSYQSEAEQLRQSLRSSWYYTPVRLGTYLFYVLFMTLGLTVSLWPIIAGLLMQNLTLLLATPLALATAWVFLRVADFKETVIDVYFRECKTAK